MKGWYGKCPGQICCLQASIPDWMGIQLIASHSGNKELLHDECSSPRMVLVLACGDS